LVPEPAGSPGLIGRTTVKDHDIGLVFRYQLGERMTDAMIRKHVFKSGTESQHVRITLRGTLHVPEAMTVIARHEGGSASDGVNYLYVDGREVGSVGDNRPKEAVYELPLDAGDYPVEWVLTGGQFDDKNMVRFLDPRTGEPLSATISADDLSAVRALPIRETVDVPPSGRGEGPE
jgi:hypothetical protein